MSLARKRYWLALAYLLVALPPMGYGAWRALQTNANSPIDWVPASFPARRAYDSFAEVFGTGDLVIISWPGCTIDEPKLDGLARLLRQSPAFRSPSGQWYFQRVTTGREVVERLTGKPAGLSRAEAVRRLRGGLIGPDGRTTCVIIALTGEGLKRRATLVRRIEDALATCCQLQPDQWHLAGPVIDGLAVDLASKRALRQLALPSAALVLYLCWWCLRSLKAALVIFGLSVVAQAAALAVVYYSGDTMNALLVVMPPLIQVLAVAGGIHLANYYFDAARNPQVEDPARQAFQIGWLPCILSFGTTAAGLASLMVSGLTPIRAFGGYASVGVVVTGGLLLAFLPATFAVWAPRRRWLGAAAAADVDLPARSLHDTEERGVGSPRTTAAGQQLRVDPADNPAGPAPSRSSGHVWDWFAGRLDRWHGLITAASLALMLAAGWGIRRTGTSVRIERLFPPRSRIIEDYRWLEQHVGPLVPIEVVLNCRPDCRLTLRQRLLLADQVQRRLQQLEPVRATLSAATFVPPLQPPPGMAGQLAERYIDLMLQQNREALAQSHYFHRSSEGEQLRVTAFVSALRNMDYGDFLQVVQENVEPLLQVHGEKLAGIETQYTGIMPLVHQIQRRLMRDLGESFLVALACITIVMTLVHGSISAGLVAMIPNVFPMLVVFGILGWLGRALDIGSVMTASVALGIAVDDTLHFLTFFQRGLRQRMQAAAAVQYAQRHCAPAMIQTSLTCGLGLLVFALSDFVPTSQFAWLMAALLAAALWGDLVVLPALLIGPCGRLFLQPLSGSAPLPPLDQAQTPARRKAVVRPRRAAAGQ